MNSLVSPWLRRCATTTTRSHRTILFVEEEILPPLPSFLIRRNRSSLVVPNNNSSSCSSSSRKRSHNNSSRDGYRRSLATTNTTNTSNNNNNRRTSARTHRRFQSNNNKSKHPKERVPIHKTPRGKAAARAKPKPPPPSSTTLTPPPPPPPPSSPSSLPSSSSSSSSSSNLKPNTSSHTYHNPTHFVKGGTPDDPAPPPFTLSSYGDDSLYTLVLLRHGESEWNSLNRYTGWCDVNLTERGISEAKAAGRLLQENGIDVDHCFTSVLKRAGETTNMALEYSDQHWVPITKSWRLNERHYGALQGYNKDTAYEELGIDQELVMEMRRSYETRPPVMMDDHPFWHGKDRRYSRLSHEQLEKSRAESLQDAAARILPFFNSQIVPSLRSGNKCLVVSHANTIRTLIKHIDSISDEDIKGMSIPTGIPLLYRLDQDLRPVDPNIELEFRYMVEPKGYTWATSRSHGFHGVYLGDLKRLQDIQRKRDVVNRDWQRIILRNVARQLDEGGDGGGDGGKKGDGVLETRQLYFHITKKMEVKEFGNMLLLGRMKDQLERLMWDRKQQYLTMEGFESILDKLHLSSKGHVVEPFVAMTDTDARQKRAQEWYEMLALDLEEECLIK